MQAPTLSNRPKEKAIFEKWTRRKKWMCTKTFFSGIVENHGKLKTPKCSAVGSIGPVRATGIHGDAEKQQWGLLTE